MKALIPLFITFSLLQAQAKVCSYSSKEGSEKMEWTAFKTTKKAPVKGTFKDVKLVKLKKDKNLPSSLEQWFKSVSFAINVKSVDTQNPQRDKTLTDQFFSLLKTSMEYMPGDIFITGKLKSLNSKKSELVMALSLNGVTKEVPFKYNYMAPNLEITGTIDLFDFGLQKAHASLHKACFELHKGDDGVSKTWTQVDLKGQVELVETCKE